MMNKEFYREFGNIDPTMIEAAAPAEKAEENKKISWVKLSSIAACFISMLIVTAITLPMMIDEPKSTPIDTTEVSNTTDPKDEAGGVNGKINVIDDLTIIAEEYKITDSEAIEYLNQLKEAIQNDLNSSGIGVSNLEIKEKGYSHIRTGDNGNSIALNWRDYLAYDKDKLVAIIQVTKDEFGINHFLLFGAPWFSRYNELMKQYSDFELVYLYIGEVEAFITPNNEVIPLIDANISSTLEDNRQYYEYFKTPYNIYVP